MPATTKKAPESFELTEGHLNTLKRKDLLNLCKERGIKCVGKNSELIEKILELRSCTSPVGPAIISYVPMTPQKKLDMCLPIVNTPGSSSVIKSIVQNARKTGLNSSPIRIPFAMSPMAMAARLQAAHVSQINFSPIKSATAKEPSLPIKEAFLNCEQGSADYIQNFEAEEESICLPFGNKRPHEDDDEIIEEHESKREKLEEAEFAADEIDEADKDEAVDETETKDHLTADFPQNPLYSDSEDSLLSTTCAPTSMAALSPSPSSFSTDLLTNLRDPELASPELTSAPDTRVSRSENQDQRASDGGTFTANPQVIYKFSSTSSAHSSSSSSNNHPLLPSGIIKLLERKRQEKEEHQAIVDPSHSHSSSQSTTVKKKFDLKESLKRSLPYKPHIGSMKNPKKERDL